MMRLQEWDFRSSTPVLGPLISAFRRFWYSMAAKWADLYLINQQSEINAKLAQTMAELQATLNSQQMASLEMLDLSQRASNKRIEELQARLSEMASLEMLDITQRASNNRIEELQATLNNKISDMNSEYEQRFALLEMIVPDLDRWMTQLGRDVSQLKNELKIVDGSERSANSQIDDLKVSVFHQYQQREPTAIPAESISAHENTVSAVSGGIFVDKVFNTEGHLDYFSFESRFRGTTDEIKERQRRYLDLLSEAGPVLDIGCGRGEFLELLRERFIEASGIDTNADMVEACRRNGLNVSQADAISYLSGLVDNSLGSIFMAQLVEHLKPRQIVRIIELAQRKLRSGGVLMIETLNPLCLIAIANQFNLDPTHDRPVHPELLRFICESNGFTEVTVQFLTPVPDEYRLRRLPDLDHNGFPAKDLIALANDNIDRLNDLLYGNQEYAVIARKRASAEGTFEAVSGKALE